MSSVVNEGVERNKCVSSSILVVKHLKLLLGLLLELFRHLHCLPCSIVLLLGDVIHYLIEHPDGSPVPSETLELVLSGTAQEASAHGGAFPHGSEFLLLNKGRRKGASFKVHVLACSHTSGADGAGNLSDDSEDGGSRNKFRGRVGDNVVEAEREEGVTGEKGYARAVDSVVRWLSSAHRIVVHTGEVVVYQRSRVDLIVSFQYY